MSEVTNAGTMTVLKVAQLARKVCLKYFFVCFFFLITLAIVERVGLRKKMLKYV